MSHQELTADPAYQVLRNILIREYGVDLDEANVAVFQKKLQRYLERHGLSSLAECIEFITGGRSRLRQLSDFIYSQSTYFNRGPEHFEFVVRTVLERRQHGRASAADPLIFWCLGCSTGQEAYTIAIYLMERVFTTAGATKAFRVIGSDCSRVCLEKARRGVYRTDDVQNLDPIGVQEYFDEAGEGQLSVAARVRERVEFNEFNLTRQRYPYHGTIDYIFLRNALDFHTRPSRMAVLSKVRLALKPGGCLILGECTAAPADGYESIRPGCFKAV